MMLVLTKAFFFVGLVQSSLDLQFASMVDCPTDKSSDATSCASGCSLDASCNGLALSSRRFCWQVTGLLTASAHGACRLFLKQKLVRLYNKCPGFDIAVPASTDRLFKFTGELKFSTDIESTCTKIGGQLADMYQGDTMLQVKNVIYDLYLRKSIHSCIYFNDQNVQCSMVLSARTLSGIDRWIPSNANFAPMKAKFDSIAKNHDSCSTYFSMTIWLNVTRHYLLLKLKCVRPSNKNYVPVCHCKP